MPYSSCFLVLSFGSDIRPFPNLEVSEWMGGKNLSKSSTNQFFMALWSDFRSSKLLQFSYCHFLTLSRIWNLSFGF